MTRVYNVNEQYIFRDDAFGNILENDEKYITLKSTVLKRSLLQFAEIREGKISIPIVCILSSNSLHLLFEGSATAA